MATWNGDINGYSIGANGTLTEVVVPPVTAGSTPESVTVDPSGRFVYVANRNSNDVYAYRIETDGALTPLGSPILAGGSPESVTVDPQGRFVYVSNWSTHTISAYTIGTGGVLTDVQDHLLMRQDSTLIPLQLTHQAISCMW